MIGNEVSVTYRIPYIDELNGTFHLNSIDLLLQIFKIKLGDTFYIYFFAIVA